jgi:hypothetical protein
MPFLSRAMIGKAYTDDDEDFIEEFVQELVLVDEEYVMIVDENYHMIVEPNE